MTADKHAPDSCPRCGRLFTCRVNTILQCDCMWIDLTPSDLRYIRDYCELEFGEHTCLCVNCLHELRAEGDQNRAINQ
ncbi:MAG: cysteine-rich CWC family protein [Spirosoma sp.]|nr:cysteine-rich CWC family protein [Spirosoma sp.]